MSNVVCVGEEPQRGELGPQLAVVGDPGGIVPGLQLHLGVQVRVAGPALGGLAIAAVHLVGEQQFQEVVVR